jgi:hypothetical protein
LQCELLPLQLEACAEFGVQAPVYLSAGLDEAMATRHPRLVPPEQGWQDLRASEGGLEGAFVLLAVSRLPVRADRRGRHPVRPDWDFLDIIHPHRDYSTWALRDMRSLGLDPEGRQGRR